MLLYLIQISLHFSDNLIPQFNVSSISCCFVCGMPVELLEHWSDQSVFRKGLVNRLSVPGTNLEISQITPISQADSFLLLIYLPSGNVSHQFGLFVTVPPELLQELTITFCPKKRQDCISR